MLTDKDIEILKTVIAMELAPMHTKIEALQEDSSAIRETVQATAVAIDKQASVNEELRQEYSMTNVQLHRHEGWINKLADKVEVKLEY